MAIRVMVSLPNEREYAVRIGQGVLDQLGDDLRACDALAGRDQALVMTDANVAPLYLAQIRRSLAAAGFTVHEVTVPAGEDTKSLEVAGEVWSAMAQLALGRDCFIVALGGGVVGDLAGFVASTYMRGVPVVQVPTTLLAMVDSSVGGKTAVNLPEGKNLVGTFHQPAFVCADTGTLATLPEREWQGGCAEVAKSAVIDSDDFFFWLSDNASALADRADDAVVAEAVKRCVVFKANVVARDVEETAGVRECLNYGHTLGHAIEACAGFGTFGHGTCVAEGMRFAARLAVRALGTGQDAMADFTEAQDQLLDDLGLARLQVEASPAQLLDAMKRDKKARAGKVRFVLATDVARWTLASVPDDVVLDSLERWLG